MSEQLPNGEHTLYEPEVKTVNEQSPEDLNIAENTDETKNYSDQYLAEHPNAIVDPDKAEKMAIASSPYEQEIISQKRIAREAADQFGDTSFINNDGEKTRVTPEVVADGALDGMKQARIYADKIADKAAQDYDHAADVLDQVNKFK